jgi:hypothetical protein
MLVIRANTSERLVLGVSRPVEFVGLLLCGLGLFAVSAFAITFLDAGSFPDIPIEILLNVGYYLLTPAVAGVFMVFSQRRFIFMAEQKIVVFCHGFGRQTIWRYDQIGFLEISRGHSMGAVAFLLLNDGHRESLSRGPEAEIQKLVEQVSHFTGLLVRPIVTTVAGR